MVIPKSKVYVYNGKDLSDIYEYNGENLAGYPGNTVLPSVITHGQLHIALYPFFCCHIIIIATQGPLLPISIALWLSQCVLRPRFRCSIRSNTNGKHFHFYLTATLFARIA